MATHASGVDLPELMVTVKPIHAHVSADFFRSAPEGPKISGETYPEVRLQVDNNKVSAVKPETRSRPKKWKFWATKERRSSEKDSKRDVEMDEHKIGLDELEQRLGTSCANGLTTAQAEAALLTYGRNVLTPPKTTPQWVKWLHANFEGFFLLLWVAAALCFIGYGVAGGDDPSNLYLGCALVIVILATGTFGWYQERHSDKIMEGFKKLLPSVARVRRNGQSSAIDAALLVPGDVIEVVAGMKIPADIRVVACINFKVDNSSLTGESEPQSRSSICTDDNPFETKNVAFSSTTVVDGSATGVVIATADRTMIGRIANLATNTKKVQSTIAKEINRFVMIITISAVIIAGIFMGIGFTVWPPIPNVVFAMSLIVAQVPEGLIATVTVCLAHAAKRMAARHVLVKNLGAVETLGSCNTICSDKTGTLTQNRMTVVNLYYDFKHRTAQRPVAPLDSAASTTPIATLASDATFNVLRRIMCLCSKASFDPSTNDQPIAQRKTLGDATESAFIKFCQGIEDIEETRALYASLAEVPFNSKNKYAASLHHDPLTNTRFVCMKGAPDRILERCSTFLRAGQAEPITAEAVKDIEAAIEELASQGQRVIGLAHLPVDGKDCASLQILEPNTPNFPLEALCFVGLVALIDPPKESVPSAVGLCKSAGIKVIMVTGDHPITAKAIARQVGIITSPTVEDIAKAYQIPKEAVSDAVDAIVVPGSEIAAFTDADWDRVLSHKEIVFARTTPAQKLTIVEEKQKRGGIVAVTGDGVNDSPALKRANIGVAMGISGSDVSKEAALMVLLDDDFSSIVAGIEEGRLVFDNLKKSIAYVLAHLGAEIIPLLLFFTIRIPVPLTTVLILVIDLGTDVFPGISLAYENAETDIMQRPPRNISTDRLAGTALFIYSYLEIGIVQTAGAMFTYFVIYYDQGFYASQLPGTATYWAEETHDDGTPVIIYDRWGNLTTASERETIMKIGTIGVFMAIVIGQFGGLIASKTRFLSMFQVNHLKNRFMLGAVAVELLIVVFVIYTPGVQTVLGTTNFPPLYFLLPCPFAIYIIFFDECRKWFIRNKPQSFIARYFSY